LRLSEGKKIRDENMKKQIGGLKYELVETEKKIPTHRLKNFMNNYV